jgi:AAA+ superfamily predicted ATPase
MNTLNLNHILNREEQEKDIENILKHFEENKKDLNIKRSIYVYGNSGTGKTEFVMNILKKLEYDIIRYDAGDIRNTSVIDDITKHNMSDKNVMSLFNKKSKKIAVVMDEIDGMNNGDKGGINSLIKLIRPKKTKKQKLEDITMNPIICIGNYHIDKKIKELMKVSHTIELKMPTTNQMNNIIEYLFDTIEKDTKIKLNHYVQSDLRKLNNMYHLYLNNDNILTNQLIDSLLETKKVNDNTKNVICNLINEYQHFDKHNYIINDTDRTSVGLLWHENIIDVFEDISKKNNLVPCDIIPFYLLQLNNICYADYIDRITFQKQIWQFNEMSSLMKTMHNHKLLHEYIDKQQHDTSEKLKYNELCPKYSDDIRFTKVLTKYSTEYNNSLFIQKLCQKLGMDKKDLYSYFNEINQYYDMNEKINLFTSYEITKLDINRIYRYIDKYIKENASGMNDKEMDEDSLENENENENEIG